MSSFLGTLKQEECESIKSKTLKQVDSSPLKLNGVENNCFSSVFFIINSIY